MPQHKLCTILKVWCLRFNKYFVNILSFLDNRLYHLRIVRVFAHGIISAASDYKV